MKRISIVGCGFVGLSFSLVAANKNATVFGVDIDEEKIQSIRSGVSPFFEPKINELLNNVLKNKKLIFTSNTREAILNSDITFVTVGTPSKSDGSANLEFVKNSVSGIAEVIKEKNEKHLIVIKSTIPPTTTNNILKPIIEKISGKKEGKGFGLIMNPEFLREGSALKDTEEPHLIVIGSNNEKDSKVLKLFYEEMYDLKVPEILESSMESAELIKYANNVFLATKISFINSVANICQKIPGTDVKIIAKAIGKDPRIGSLFLNAGPGYGGSCFPKDVNALIEFSKKIGYEPVLFNATKKVNELQVSKVLNIIQREIPELENKIITVFGLSFKKDTDDVRESVSIKLINSLLEKGVKIKAHDPMAIENSRKIFGKKIMFCDNLMDSLDDSECCVVMTDWDNYKDLEDNNFRKMKNKVVIDARRILNPKKCSNIKIVSIGEGHD